MFRFDSFLSNLPFPVKFAISPAITLLLMGIMAYVASEGLEATSADIGYIVEHHMEGSAILADVRTHTHDLDDQIYRLLAEWAVAPLPPAKLAQRTAAIKATSGAIASGLRKYRDQFADVDQRKLIDEALKKLSDVDGGTDFVIAMLDVNFMTGAAFTAQLDKLILKMSEIVDVINANALADSHRRAADARGAAQRVRTLFLMTMLASALVIVVAAWQVGLSTTRSIRVIANATLELAKEGTSVEVDELIRSDTRSDELGEIVESLRIFRQMVSERKLAVESLRESEARYRRIVDTASEGIWVLGPDFLTTFANDSMAEMLGYSAGEMIGTAVTDFMFGEDAPDHLAKMENRKNGISERYERRLRRKSGEILWTIASARPIFDAENCFRGSFAMFTDITERKRAEEDIGRLNERFALATSAARLGVWDWDLEKDELVWDDRMYALYGNSRERRAGVSADWLQGVHPDDRARAEEMATLARRGEREYETEFRVAWPDGSVHYLKAYGQVVRDADGRPLRMIGVAFDVTERKLADEEIRTLNRELEQRVAERTAQLESANKELEAFSYSVSHDLRAPLRHIDGFLGLLKNRIEKALDEESLRYMAVVSDSALRMATLIDDLLSFARMGRLELARTQVDLGALMRDVIREFEPQTSGRAIDWRIADLPVVTGDRAMLRIVLVNLISNALKYTEPRAQAEIEIACVQDQGTETIISIRDNGVGFDMKYADKLFGVFQRLHGAEEFEGTGIGLANVRRVISRHGGRTWAEGKVDGGATFYFALPRTAGA
jgi:PAS domain S-box-containing protein